MTDEMFESWLLDESKKWGKLLDQRMAEADERRARGDRDELFAYLAINLLSPREKWETAKAVIDPLALSGRLFHGNEGDIREKMGDAGFGLTNKAKDVIAARDAYWDESNSKFILGVDTIVKCLPVDAPKQRRVLLDRNIYGFGFKTASHFLRGVNLAGNELAILDRQLAKVLSNWPRLKLREDGYVGQAGDWNNLGKKRYLEIESRLKSALGALNIGLDRADLLLWRLGQRMASSVAFPATRRPTH